MAGTQADFNATRDVLGSAGIPILGKMVNTHEEATAIAEELGYPVVMKLVSPDVIHKSDAGVVLLDIDSSAAVAAGWNTIMERAQKAGAKRIDGILVQKQARPGFEVLVGARQDPIFGPVTMVGHGGKLVELYKDVCPGVGVLSRADVERMLSQTLAGRVIDGFRGPPLDKEAVIDLALKVSRLMDERPDLTELDLNPVILYPKGFAIVDARMILGDPVFRPRAGDMSPKRMESLRAIFEARSVAVVGASKPGSIGGIILKNSSRVGKLFPINPKRETLLGLKCYKTFQDIGEPVDVAVFAVSPETTIKSFDEFCEAKGRGAIVVSDGFAEIGRTDLEDQLRAVSVKHDVVYIGPNGLGVFDNFSGLNTMFLPIRRSEVPSHAGPIGIISQSGGIGLELLEMLAADNLPVGQWVSCGNASGVSIAELLAHMGNDPRIKVVAAYIEGMRNGRQFMEIGREVAKKKPVIIIKGGVGGGAAATMSHTASLAGSFEAFKAACNQAGFFLLEDLTEDPKILINVLSILTRQRPARNDRVAVVSVGGGAAILLADQVTAMGMRITTFTDRTKARLSELLAFKIHAAGEQERARIAQRVAANPLDLFGDADDDRLLDALHILDEDENTDAIVAALYFQVPYLTEYIAERLVEVNRELHKPLIISPRGFSPYLAQTRAYMTSKNLQTYTVPMVKPLRIAMDIWRRYPSLDLLTS